MYKFGRGKIGIRLKQDIIILQYTNDNVEKRLSDMENESDEESYDEDSHYKM